MTSIIEEIRSEARTARHPAAGLELDRDATPRAQQVEAETRRIQAACTRDVAALEAQIRDRKAAAEHDTASVRDAATELHEQIESKILDEFQREIEPHIAAFDDAGTKSTRAIVDLVAVMAARVRRELGVEFDAPRHLAWAVCMSHVAREPHTVNTLAEDAWIGGIASTHTLTTIAKLAIDSFADEAAARDALRRLKEFAAHHARNARRDLIGEQAAVRFETRRLGADAESQRRWAQLVEQRQSEREQQRQQERLAAAPPNTRSGPVVDGSAPTAPLGWAGPGFMNFVKEGAARVFGS